MKTNKMFRNTTASIVSKDRMNREALHTRSLYL